MPTPTLAGGVVTNCTEASLRAAMADGGAVTFACDGTITLASTITNALDTVLDATGHQIIISGGNAVRLFLVYTNTHFSMTNLSLAYGYSPCGSAIVNLGGVVGLGRVVFSTNTAFPSYYGSSSNSFSPGCGGAILNAAGTVTADNCSFTNNTAATSEADMFPTLHFSASGGAICNQGQMNLRSCVFAGNKAAGGNSIVQSIYGLGDPGFGGAIDNQGALALDLCTLAGNSASGGASCGDPTGLPGAEAWGGAINNGGTLTITRSTFSGNRAVGGNGGAGMRLSDPNNPNGFPGGAGGSAGGGAVASAGWLSVEATTFVSNVVTAAGGGPGGSGRQTTTDTGGNGANGANGGFALGGALRVGSGIASLINCTVVFNDGNGGAGGNGGNGAMSVMGSSGGNGGNGGAGVGGIAGSCSLANCTLAGNVGTGGPGGSGGSSYLPGGSSGPGGTPGVNGGAWGATDGGTQVNTLIASNTPPGGDTFANPKLGPLARNGGPTMTIALMPGSPAIDAGNTAAAPRTDQRGFPRPGGSAADIGAYEYGSMLPVLSIARSSPTLLDILVRGNTNQWCRLLASSNLSIWVPVATNQIGSDGSVLFQDTCGSPTCRFYRVVMP